MRTLFASAIAVVVTALLFLLMQALIKSDVLLADEAPPQPVVAVVEAPPEPPEPPESPVEPPKLQPTPPGITTELAVLLPSPAVQPVPFHPPGRDPLPTLQTTLSSTSAGDPIPIAAFPPQYPHAQLLSGTEGWVRIGFTIEADGSVSDASVVDAHPRRGLFDAAALNAIERWRFKPRRNDAGEPVESRAAYTIEFTIDDA